MNWITMCRLLEATDNKNPTQQVKMISKAMENFEDKESFFKILSLDLESNNIGLAKAKKWLTKMFGVFEEEIELQYNAHNDLGDGIYYLDYSAETNSHTSLANIVRLLELDCDKVNNSTYILIKDAIFEMSSLERRWFIRYWLRTPRNGINAGLCLKIVAKFFDVNLSQIKKYANFNSLHSIVNSLELNVIPAMNLSHGSFVSPMLAKEVPMSKWSTNCIVDYKYDGNRYQIHRDGDSVIIFNRKGKIVTKQFQDVVEQIRTYPISPLILDGEIYPINDDGSPAEHKLMATRVHSKNHEEAMQKVKVRWVIFDCMKIGNATIMDLPYGERLEKFSTLPDQAHRMEKDGDIMAFYNNAINDGFEGIIVKDATMSYEAGKRSMGWAKYKPPRIELDVVIISAEYGEGKKSNVFATFEIAVKSESGFTSVGKVGTGFSDADLLRLTSQLRTHIESFNNGIYSFLPRVVLQVKADLISKDAKGNYGLRFPRMERIRDDKFVVDINTLEDLERLS